jgi:hypothetical protein
LPAAADDPVVARVNGVDIKQSISILPPLKFGLASPRCRSADALCNM